MKNFQISIKVFLYFSLLTGLIYPALVTLVSQVAFSGQANGSLIVQNDKVIGSELIAQPFKDPKYFWPRPSAIDYNPMPSGGSNLGPSSKDLLSKIDERRKLGFTRDLLFASGSGLDPHISKEAAMDQVERVAKTRGIPPARVGGLLDEAHEPRQLGFLGEERINVLKLNLSLDQLK